MVSVSPQLVDFLVGRHAGFDIAQQPTDSQLRDQKTLRRRDSDEVSVAQLPPGVIQLPIMTPKAREASFEPIIIDAIRMPNEAATATSSQIYQGRD